MSFEERKSLLHELEELRQSKAIAFYLSDRETFPQGIIGFQTQFASDQFLPTLEVLRRTGKTEKLDLVLYTRGGDTNSVWPIVNLFRAFTNHLSILVPHRSHSAGTLLCLGADELVLGPIAELSPIDPTTGNQFNPPDPTNPTNRLGISVEDVISYFELSEKRAGIKGEAFRLEVLKELTKQVHPVALGNVERVYMQIRKLARNLLNLHLKESESPKIEPIIKALTEEFYTHLHAIDRKASIDLLGKEWVRATTDPESEVLWKIFDAYNKDLSIPEKFNLPTSIGDELNKHFDVIGGFIESSLVSKVYCSSIDIHQRPNLPPNMQVQVPLGGQIPLMPGFSRAYDFSIQSTSWKSNGEGE